MASTRREARERALSLLYEAESKSMSVADVLAGQPAPPDAYATELAEGVERESATIDGLLRGHLHDWPLERLAVVDRAVLRLAVFELLDEPDVPTGAVLSEAVELASRYSTGESGRFVNGVLAAISERVRDV